MGTSFSVSPESTPPAPRETWTQRMSRRVIRRRDPRDAVTRAHPRELPQFESARTVTTPHEGEQEEVDQLTAFRTGAFEGLDSRNGAAP